MNTTLARLLFVGFLFSAGMAHGKSPVYKTVLGGLAVKGYDPVAYFDAGKPVKGDKKFVHEHKGAKWRFSSQKNLDAFKADTAKYEPQYGGYCAWAVSQGYTAKIDPEAWKIVDGKLYLNYSRKIQAKWEKDVPGFIKKADENWPGVLK